MSKLSLVFFIDAFGWQIYQDHPVFLSHRITDAKPLRSILGYSSACDPSIISGKLPAEHGLWSSYYYTPHTSPFKWLHYLSYLPTFITSTARVRNQLSLFTKKHLNIDGYFQLYNVPFEHINYFDYAEKKRIWDPGGMAPTRTIFDDCRDAKKRFFVHHYTDSDDVKLYKLQQKVARKSIQFAYISLGQLDGDMHIKGTKGPHVRRLLNHYENQIETIIGMAEKKYDTVDWIVISDHGMHDVYKSTDMMSEINELELTYGTDYIAFYDSTMARFWPLTPIAKQKLINHLLSRKDGRLLSPEQLQEYGVYYPDHRYGELIYLCYPHYLICPSYMGNKPIKGMHGYEPSHTHSLATILSNRTLPDMSSIEEIYQVMHGMVF